MNGADEQLTGGTQNAAGMARMAGAAGMAGAATRRSENIQGSPSINGPIDLVAFARETTRRDLQRVAPGSLKIIAPAKVNLFLGVGAKRDDGYHEVANVLHAIMLHDVLYMKATPVETWEDDAGSAAESDVAADSPAAAHSATAAAGADANPTEYALASGTAAAAAAPAAHSDVGPACATPTADASVAGSAAPSPLSISIQCVGYEGVSVPDIPPEENLCYRAVMALARAIGRTEREHIAIRLEKHIPHQAGLGGGSADAAAALLGAARLWGVEGDPVIEDVAAGLGADVPFFLHGGCSLFMQRGDVFHHALEPRTDNLVLIKPEGGLSTAAVYRAFDESNHALSETALAAVAAAQRASDLPLLNSLAAPAQQLMPELERIRLWACEQPGARAALLSGSGAASFVVCESFDAACKIAAAAKNEGWWARTTALGSLRAAVAGGAGGATRTGRSGGTGGTGRAGGTGRTTHTGAANGATCTGRTTEAGTL